MLGKVLALLLAMSMLAGMVILPAYADEAASQENALETAAEPSETVAPEQTPETVPAVTEAETPAATIEETVPAVEATVEQLPAATVAEGGTSVTLTDDRYPSATKIAAGETVTYTHADFAAASGDMLLFSFDVRCESECSAFTIQLDFSGTDTTMKYYAPIQWTRVYMPVTCSGSLNCVKVTANTGAVLIGATALENKGNATIDDLKLQSGMWMLDDFQDVALDADYGVRNENQDVYTALGVSSSKCVDLVISSCGNYVYSIGNGALTVTDVSDPSNPKVRSIYNNPDYPNAFGSSRQIALLPNMGENGDAVIFTGRISGAFIVDVSDPDNPVERSHYDAQEMATGIASYENYAFIANRQYGVEVVDVSDLENPVHLGVVARGGEVQSCKVVDGILYCGIYDKSKVEMYDVTDVVNAKLLGTAMLDGHGDGLTVATIDGRTYLYAGTGHHSAVGITHDTLNNLNYGNGNGLEIFDVTDPTKPVLLSVSKNDGRFCHAMCDYWGAEVAVKDGKVYVYLLNTYNGVHIYDATNPAAPVRLAHVTVRVDKDSPYYNNSSLTHVTTMYPYIFGYDPDEYKQAPVGAMTVYEGALYLAGVYTDLHIYETDLAHPLVVDEDPVPVAPDTPYFNNDLVAVRPGGQTVAIANYKDYMYVAAGSQGILIYSKDLKTLHKTIPVEDICYDLYIQNGLLYTAEGRSGAAVYTIGSDGLTLTETKRYVSSVDLVTTIRPSATGKFLALSVGPTTGEIVDISATPKRVASCSTGTQAYHHYVQMTANGRYVVFWGLSGYEQWYDFGANDSYTTPKKLFSTTFRSRAAMAGGYTAYKDNMVIMTRSNGYVYYDPTTLTGAQIEDLALNHLIRPVNAYGSATKTSIYGRGIVHENLLISCDRVYGRMYITDITDIDNPVLIKSWTGVKGTPDIATVVDDTLYIPRGYEGIMMEDLTPYITGHTHCDCGTADAGGVGDHTCNDAQKWTKWTSKTTLPTTAGYYYLSEDVTLTATNWQTNQQDIHICLNGHTVTGPTDNFLIFIRGELTVTDCKPVGQQGQMIAQADIAGSVFYLDDYDGGSTAVDSELTIYGGTYRNSLESVTKSGGLLFMGNKTLGGTTTFNMYGGMFIGAKTTTNGGSINAFRKPTINLYGGTITGGSADKGGAIYILTGTLNIKGGNITDNTATANGGAVCFYDSTVNVSGGTITGNSAVSGGVIYTSGGTVNVTGGTIVGNSATEGGAFYGVSSTKGKPVNFNIEGGTFYTAKNENYDNPATTNTAQHGGHIAVVGLKDVSIVSVKKGADLSYGYTTGDEKGRCGGNIFAYDGVVNIHDGGLVSYGRAYLGGNIYIGGTTGYQSICTMSGGSVTEGVATCASYSGDFYPQGGNLFIAGGEKFVLKGGAISNGFASHAGGNICMDASGNMEMSDGTVSGGLASYGGNIALNNSTGVRLTVGGGEIIGGSLDRTTAKNGTGHCIRVNANSNVVLKGQPVIDEIFFCSITGTKLDATQMESLKRPIHICVVNNTKDFAFATVDEDLSGSFLLTARSYYAPNEYYVIPAGHAHYIEGDGTLTVSRHARTSGSCMELVEAKTAAGTEPGHEAYWKCLDCTYTTNITPIAPEPEKFSIKFARLNLANEINMQFAFEKGERDWTGAYAKIEKDYVGDDTMTQTIELKDWVPMNISGVSHYVVSFSGIAAKEMGDEIRVTIYNAEGEAISEVWVDSVQDYILRNIDTAKEEEQKLFADMLYYGAAAQNYFDYDEANLVTAAMTDAQKALASTSVTTENNQIKGTNYAATRLTLTNRIELQVAFENVDSTMRAEYTFTDHRGNEWTIPVAGSEFKYGNGWTIVVVDTQALSDARQEVTVKVYNAAGEEVASAVDSVESYVNRNAENTSMKAEERLLHQRIMMFANSAYEYFH